MDRATRNSVKRWIKNSTKYSNSLNNAYKKQTLKHNNEDL